MIRAFLASTVMCLALALSPAWGDSYGPSPGILPTGALTGLSSYLTGGNLQYTNYQNAGNSGAVGGNMAMLQFSNDNSSAFYTCAKSRGTTHGAQGAVQLDDDLCELDSNGSDGTNWVTSSYFTMSVDNVVSAGNVPTRFEWGAYNAAGFKNEHMRLSAEAVLTVGDTINNTYNTVKINPGVAAATPLIQMLGPNAAAGLTIETKGASNISFDSGGFAPMFAMIGVGSAVDYLSATPVVTGNPGYPKLSAAGSDTNIGINFVTKGTGALEVNGTSGVTCSGSPTASFASTLGLVTHC